MRFPLSKSVTVLVWLSLFTNVDSFQSNVIISKSTGCDKTLFLMNTSERRKRQQERFIVRVYNSVLNNKLNNEDDEDDDALKGEKKESGNLDGKDLASLFYKQLAEREKQQQKKNDNNDDRNDSNVQNSNKSLQSNNSRNKFTGKMIEKSVTSSESTSKMPLFASRPFSSSSSIFSPENEITGPYSSSSSSTPTNDKYYESRKDEFDLVGRFEQTIYIQAVIVLFAFIFAIYIGLSGGITDGSDRYFEDDDDSFQTTIIPEVVMKFNQASGVSEETSVSDSDKSIWL